MLLTLVPPPSIILPEELQTHALRPPSNPKALKLKVPQLYLRAQRSLSDVGIVLPNELCADRALWWSIAVAEVIWDLECDSVEVRFVDGSEERWELDPPPKSSQEVDEDSDLEADRDHPLKMDVDSSEWRAPSAGDKGKDSEGPRPPASIPERLRALCVQLRDAYENVGHSFTYQKTDYAHLLLMASDPNKRGLDHWDGPKQSDFEWAMQRSSDDEHDWNLEEDAPIVSARRLRDPSPVVEADAEEAVTSAHEFASNSPSNKSGKFSGQFKRIPRASSHAPEASTSKPSSAQGHDHLVAILTVIRRTLLDLFSSSVIPELKERLSTPTYAIWVAESAAKWCREQAIIKGGEVAKEILKLLDDDGYTFDVSDIEEDELLDDEMDDDEWALRHGAGGSSPKSPGAQREARLRRNVMYDMREDYDLRLWCERAQLRAQGMGRDEPLGEDEDESGWAADSGIYFPSSVGAPRFFNDPPSWEVSKRYPSTLLPPPRKNKRPTLESIAAAELGSPTKSTSSSSLTAGTSRGQLIRTYYHGNGGNSFSRDASPPLTDTEDDDDFLDPSLAFIGQFFYPEDPLGESLLPPKLPRALVTRRHAQDLPKDMAAEQRLVHETLNEVAGLQKKIMELREYVDKATEDFESARAEERRAKTPDVPDRSGLSKIATSTAPSSPPRPASPAGTIPLSRQPLRQRAGDKSVATIIDQTWGPKKRQAIVAASSKDSRKGFGTSPPASPRKRARDNLVMMRQDLATLDGDEKPKKKKRKKGEGKDVVSSMRKKRAKREAKAKGLVLVRQDEDLMQQSSGPSNSAAGPSRLPLLGTFPPNPFARDSDPQLQFPPSPRKPSPHAFIPPETSPTLTLPPLTPPSSPPEPNVSPPAAPRLTAQQLGANRSTPRRSLDSLTAELLVDESRPYAHEDEETSDEELSEADDDDEVIEIAATRHSLMQDDDVEPADEEVEVDVEALIRADGIADEAEERDDGGSDDEDEGWVPHRSEEHAPDSTAASFDDIQVTSYDEDESAPFDIPTAAPQWILSYSSPPQDVDTAIPRTPSSFPKSFGSLNAEDSSLPLSPPPSATVPQFATSFPMSSSRDDDEPQSARAHRPATPSSVLDPTLAALTLESSLQSTGRTIWSPSPLRPAFQPTAAPVSNFGPPLTRSTSDASLTSPPPSSTVPRLRTELRQSEVDSFQASAFGDEDEGLGAAGSGTVLQPEPEPATARAQAGARFISRMLLSGDGDE